MSNNNQFDFSTLVENISNDQSTISKIQNKELVLFLGTTNAGKTTTICFFSDKPLTVKQDFIKDPEGNQTLGEEVIDTLEHDDEFRIGHSCDSTTSSIHILPLPDSEIILADSCGFQDTQGSTIDIANAVSLRNAMKLSLTLRPVVIIDVNVISVDKGIPFVQLLKLLIRFFSPIQQFLQSMNFFFTHGRPDLSSEEITRSLSRLSNATHIKNDPDMKLIVTFLFSYVKKNSDRCILLSVDIASPYADRVSTKRKDVLNLVLQTTPISQEMIHSLGCPISTEAQTSLREKCQEIKISIIYHLGIYQYSNVQKQLNQLQCLHKSVDLHFVTELFKDCCEQVSNHLKMLFESIDSNLKDKNYEQLRVDFSRCYDAKRLPQEFSVDREYNHRLLALGQHLIEIGNKILLGDQNLKENEKWSINCAALDDLKLIDQYLNSIILQSQKNTHGYNTVMKWVEISITSVNQRCEGLLKNFKQLVLSQSNGEENNNDNNKVKIKIENYNENKYKEEEEYLQTEFSSLQMVLQLHPKFLPNNKFEINNNNQNHNDMLLFPLFVLFHDIEFLKSLSTLKMHISSQYLGLFDQRLAELVESLHKAHKLIYGENGFLKSIENMTLSHSKSSKITQLHDLLQVCYSIGGNDHVPCDLYDLPSLFVEEIVKILTSHLNHIDNCLMKQKFTSIEKQLRVSLMVYLKDSTFVTFKSLNIENKINLVKENVNKIFEECFQRLNKIKEKNIIESLEFIEACKFMSLQRDCCCLDFLFENVVENDIESKNDNDNNDNTITPSQRHLILDSIAENDWTIRVSQFLKSIVGNDSSLIKQTFVRLDFMNPLCEFHHGLVNDIRKIISTIEQSIIRVTQEDARNIDFLNKKLLDYLHRGDVLLDLCSCLHSSLLLSQVIQDVESWSMNLKNQLKTWKENSLLVVQSSLKDAQSKSRESLQNKNHIILSQQLDILHHHRCFDAYLHPTASKIYEDTLHYLRSELESLVKSGQTFLKRGDLEKYNSIRIFLEGSTSYGIHFVGFDFGSVISSMLIDHREIVNRIPDEIQSLLESKRFNNIRIKLINVKNDDSEIFDECDSMVTNQFRKIYESILYCDSMSELSSHTLNTLLTNLETIENALVLSGVSTYDPLNLLRQIQATIEQFYLTTERRILNSLKSYRFQPASQLFDLLSRFKMFDLQFNNIRKYLSDNFITFKERIDKLVENHLVTLEKTLMRDCESFLGSNTSDSIDCDMKTDDNDDSSSIVSSLESHLSSPINVESLENLTKAVSETSEKIVFNELVDFSSIKTQLGKIIHRQYQKISPQINNNIGSNQLELAGILIENSQTLLDICQTILIPTIRSKWNRELEKQKASLQCANEDTNRSRPLLFKVSEIDNISLKLSEMKTQEYKAYSEIYSNYFEQFSKELQKWENIMEDRTNLISTYELDKLFSFILFITPFKEKVIDGKDSEPCNNILEHFTYFLDELLVNLKESIENDKFISQTKQLLDFLKIKLPQFEINPFRTNKVNEWKRLVEENVMNIEKVLNRLAEDRQNVATYDLFLSTNSESIVEKLDGLKQQEVESSISESQQSKRPRREKSPQNDTLNHIKQQLSQANKKFDEYLSSQNYETAARGFQNVLTLSEFEDIKNECKDKHTTLKETLKKLSRNISNNCQSEFQNQNYKELDKWITMASSLDVHFHSLIEENCDPLMDEIASIFKTELTNILSYSNKPEASLEDHVQNVIMIKTLVADISNQEIQSLAEKFIQEYLKKLTQVDFFKFGVMLSESGPLGEEVTEQYPQFKSVLTKRFNEATAGISIEHALTAFSTRNPNITESQIEKLKSLHQNYSESYDKNLKSYLKGYGSSFRPRNIDDLVRAIYKSAEDTKKQKSNDLIPLLAGVFSLWTIMTSEEMFRETKNNSCLIRPHAVQLIAIFRLLGLDKSVSIFSSILNLFMGPSSSIDGHLIEVGTGEGKSILLGGLSCVLALLDFEVYCASYSQHLSSRDHEAFLPLFKKLNISKKIHYSTLSGLAESVINSKGDVRQLTSDFLSNRYTTSRNHQHKHDKPKRILLIDEVDVFFSPDFFGSTYNPVSPYSSPEIRSIFNYIWNNKPRRVHLREIQQLQEYTNLISSLKPGSTYFINQQIHFMINDCGLFNEPCYELVNQEDGSKKIGYKDQDSVNCSLTYGYRTAFAYLHEVSKHPGLASHVDDALSIQIPCGCFSYAEIPKHSFECIMGVTGTLSCLSSSERDIIKNEYNLNEFTYTPSMYGDSKLSFKKHGDVLMESDVQRYYQTILKEIDDERQKGRPVIVYFESVAKLNEFKSSNYGQRLNDVNIVTEKTTNIPFYVNKAATARTVTLFPRVFGRGLDFVCRDSAVDDVGGVHIIQTFFSDFVSEEIQIRGRTARQSKKGSFKIILLLSDLEKLGMSSEEITKSYESNTFYDQLNAKRLESITSQMNELMTKAIGARETHTKSKEFLKKMRHGVSATDEEIFRDISSFHRVQGSSEPLNLIFCLDESGSMSSSWSGLIQAFLEFLNIRKEKGGSQDLVTVIQFSSTARVTMNAVSLEDAIVQGSRLDCGGGGTNFTPALIITQQSLANQPHMSSVIVFMTDGDCADSNQSINRCTDISQMMPDRLQFFGIAFNTNGGTLLRMTTAASGAMVSAANIGELREKFQDIAREVSANITR